MLRLLMLGYVVEQGLLVGETFIAGVTLVGFVSLMTAGVGLQVGQLGEGLGATWMCKSEQKVLIVSCPGSSGTIDSPDRDSIGGKN